MSRIGKRMNGAPLYAHWQHSRKQRKILCSLERQGVSGINGTYGAAWAYGLARLYERQLALRRRMGFCDGIVVFSDSGRTPVAMLMSGKWQFRPSHWEAGSIPSTVLGDVVQHARRHDPGARNAPPCHVIAEAFRVFLHSLRSERSDSDYPQVLLRILRA